MAKDSTWVVIVALAATALSRSRDAAVWISGSTARLTERRDPGYQQS
jgi:hypothetical protein